MIASAGLKRLLRESTALGLLRGALLAIALALVAFGATPASAAASGWWQLGAEAAPTNLPPDGHGRVVVAASDLGDAPIEGSKEPVTIAVKLPAGLVASSVETFVVHGVPVQCTITAVVSCEFTGVLYPYERLELETNWHHTTAARQPPNRV